MSVTVTSGDTPAHARLFLPRAPVSDYLIEHFPRWIRGLVPGVEARLAEQIRVRNLCVTAEEAWQRARGVLDRCGSTDKREALRMIAQDQNQVADRLEREEKAGFTRISHGRSFGEIISRNRMIAAIYDYVAETAVVPPTVAALHELLAEGVSGRDHQAWLAKVPDYCETIYDQLSGYVR